MIKNALIGIAFIAGVAGFVISMYNQNIKLVYIEMGKVYEEFHLSKELNKELEKVLSARKLITDSLFEDLRRKTQDLKYQEKKTIGDIQKLAKLEEECLYKREQFQKENQSTSSEYNTKIWNQINQLVHDYGVDNKLTIVFGANGQGNIMYGDERKNVTKEVIEYINNRYNDKLRR
jgi:outer membrane protein